MPTANVIISFSDVIWCDSYYMKYSFTPCRLSHFCESPYNRLVKRYHQSPVNEAVGNILCLQWIWAYRSMTWCPLNLWNRLVNGYSRLLVLTGSEGYFMCIWSYLFTERSRTWVPTGVLWGQEMLRQRCVHQPGKCQLSTTFGESTTLAFTNVNVAKSFTAHCHAALVVNLGTILTAASHICRYENQSVCRTF